MGYLMEMQNYNEGLFLNDHVAIITGASRGIGKAIALELARRGAAILINYNQSEIDAKMVFDTIQDAGGKAILFQGDVSKFQIAQKMVDTAIGALGRIDILVNNAGITRDKLILLMNEDDWDLVQSVNLKSTFNCSKAVIKYMIRKKYGRIINISSISGQMGNPGQTNYSASKAGQIGFTKALAREVASRNITVNAVAAGYIDTEIWSNVSQEIKNSMLSMIPLGRKGTPQEIAYLVAFLASDQASYITGQIIGIDGGLAMM